MPDPPIARSRKKMLCLKAFRDWSASHLAVRWFSGLLHPIHSEVECRGFAREEPTPAHILVVAAPAPLLRQVSRAISEPETLVTAIENPEELWGRLGEETFDVVVVRRASVPSFSPTLVDEIRRLPDRPEVIVLSDCEDPEERAALLRAGCQAVIADSLSEPTLGLTLHALVERRRDEAVCRMRVRSAGDQFRLGNLRWWLAIASRRAGRPRTVR
jgi:DNA-binding response OmpR family regulator